MVEERQRRGQRSGCGPELVLALALLAAGTVLPRSAGAREQPTPAMEPAALTEPVQETPDPGFVLLPPEPREPPEPLPVPPPEPPEDWRLRLISRETPLPEDFTEPELTRLANGHAIDARAYPDLQRMMDDCRAAGHAPLICSSYRSHDKQTRLFQSKQDRLRQAGVPEEALWQEAARWVAVPGTSEHEGGLALDIVDRDYQLLDEAQAETPAQQWLLAHCQDYGFILRYPRDKEAVTGIGYEPWHYRYVGREAAQTIMSQGICLEEYIP